MFLATVLAVAATIWVHGVLYSGGTLFAHAPYVGLDMLLALPFAGAAVWAGGRLASRLGFGQGLAVRGAAAALVFTVLFVPLAALQSASHAVLGGGAAGAAAAGHHHAAAEPLAMLSYGLTTAAMVWPAALVAALVAVVGLQLTDRRGRRRVLAGVRSLRRPLVVAASGTALVAGIGAAAFLPASPAVAQVGNCDTAPQRVFNVLAINVEVTINRHGDNDPWGFMYVLEHNLDDLRLEEQQNRNAAETGANQGAQADLDWAEQVYDAIDDGTLDPEDRPRFVQHGLRDDLIQPLVLRARIGECVVINLRNDLEIAPVGGVTNRLHQQPGGVPAVSIDMQGVSYDAAGGDGGQDVGNNSANMAEPGQTSQYRFFLDSGMEEGTKVFRSGGESTQLTAHGLFGALIAEPPNATWHHPATGANMTGELNAPETQWSNWEAMINPNDGTAAFREFTIMYHEIGDENFSIRRPVREAGFGGQANPLADPFDPDENDPRTVGGALPMIDVQAVGAVGGEFAPWFRGGGTKSYRPGTRALNYRSESFFRRLQHDAIIEILENDGDLNSALQEQINNKALGYSSFAYGDPATPMPRSYLGEPTKTRLTHVGFQQLHVHHLHGGATRWRQNPGADDTAFDSGLDKRPIQDAQSIRLDSQTISPEESFNLEHECGAGGCQQAAGDFLYHCHIAHHYIAGMWSFWRVFDTDQSDPSLEYPLAPLPDRTVPVGAVTSDGLLGLEMPDGRTVVADGQVTDPDSQVGLAELIEPQLPPPGVPFHKHDSTVWDWDRVGNVYQGPPGTERIWDNYRSDNPGQRVPILFNPSNGRPAFPLLSPDLTQRPPFSPNEHSGAPWLGDTADEGRPDGLCPVESDVRHYDITAVSVDIPMTERESDHGGMLYVLNEDKQALLDEEIPADPLVIRSNVSDCVAITFGNEIDNAGRADDATLDQLARTNMHTHFVQFDPLASDGVITGLSFEQSIFPAQREGRTLESQNSATSITVNHVDDLREGIAIAIALGTPEIEIRTIAEINGNTITLDRPLEHNHDAGVWVTVEFVQYRWYSDVDSGTVFWHDHVDGIVSWAHGLFAAHIIEPPGSTYHDPVTGEEVNSGTIVDIRNSNPNASVGVGQSGSFREFMIFLHNGRPASQVGVQLPGQLSFNVNQECEEASINLRAAPFGERTPVDPNDIIVEDDILLNVDPDQTHQRWEFNGFQACRTTFDRTGESGTNEGTAQVTVTTVDPYVYSSVTYGEPTTPLLRAYAGDDVVIRTIGLNDRGEALRFQGHQFRMERFHEDAQLMDTAVTGISERFDYVLHGGAGGPAGMAGDYLYHSARPMATETGGWGIFRVHDTFQEGPNGLQQLPDNPVSGGQGFPILEPNTAENPQANPGAAPPAPSANVVSNNTEACPAPGQLPRIYSITVFDHVLPSAPFEDTEGIVYALTSDVAAIQSGQQQVEPLVLRANEGDCVIIRLRNRISNDALYGGDRAGLDMGQLTRNPQLSGGGAFGLNPDTTVAAGQNGEYRFLAEEEGTTLFTNIGSPASIRHGAYGMFIVEPAGSTWVDAETGAPLGPTNTSTQAIINAPGQPAFREFAVNLHSTDVQYSRSVVPYVDAVAGSGINSPRDAPGNRENVRPAPIAGAPPGTVDDDGSWNKAFNHINYHSEPLTERLGLTACPGHVEVDGNDGCQWWDDANSQFEGAMPFGSAFSSAVHGEPRTPVFSAHTGDRVVFRVGVGGSDQLHSFIISGHRFPLEPNMAGALEMSSRTITTGQTIDAWLIGGAGQVGDYAFRDSRQPWTAAGLWGIFRVEPAGTGGIVSLP